ncbi:MAG: TlpA disulfide reductase family protein [Acidobacteriota bacterium]|nr:TlpA disulfide reductase family protein [Acidobacteriota bacterium]
MSELPPAGSQAPAFSLRDRAGAVLTFADQLVDPTLLFFFKHDCATCDLTAPLIERLHRAFDGHGLRVVGVSQDPEGETLGFVDRHGLSFDVALDTDLTVSADYGFDAVPALVLADGSRLVRRSFEGFVKQDLLDLITQAAARCNAEIPNIVQPDDDLPDHRPGCGSRVHDPEVARRLAVLRGASRLGARRIRIPVDDDPFEFMTSQGLDDGLPVVPPTEDRVLRMLDGTTRSPSDVVAHVPPNLAPATVEKVAINAVMAGCRPEYLPVVIAAAEAACTDEFNLHGVLATTYFATPVLIVNGPIRHEIGLNCGGNAFGQGFRANATIGRALQLLVRNVGGGRPGDVDMSTLGQPGKFTCCIGENEELSGWDPLHVERGFSAETSTVTLFAGEAPRAIRDQLSRTARSLATSMGLCLDTMAHPKIHLMGEVVLVVSPEHAKTFAREGFSKTDLRARIQEVTARPLRVLLPDDDCQKGMALGMVPAELRDSNGQPTPDGLDTSLSKFRRNEDILIVVAGGTAGKFSAMLGGWASGATGSTAVTREITR